jgi:anti-sigma-K factor RskA
MNGHPTRPEDFDLYALGALEDTEKAAIESHIAACAECAKELSEAQGRIALLAFAAPRVDPSPAVKERLMRQLRSPSETSGARHAPAPAIAGTGGFFGRWWAAALVPVGVALAIATVFLWKENVRLNHELAEERSAIQEQQKQLDETRHVAKLIEAKDTVSVSLAGQPGMPKGAVQVKYNAKMGMLMADGWIDPAPKDKSYQLWVVPMEGKPISAGVLTHPTGPIDHWMMKVPQGVAPKAFAVSLEPSGGMPEPTGPMVLVGPGS